MTTACLRSAAQAGEAYHDSLYTLSYLKHRLFLCKQAYPIPRAELRRFEATASLTDSLLKRWPSGVTGPDAFLPYWAAHPELDEDVARAKFGLPRPAIGTCAVDSSGYAAARRRLTALQTTAYRLERGGDTAAALLFLDTIGREFPFTAATSHAKRLAIAGHDTAAYLRALAQSQYPSFAEARRREPRWPVANTPAQQAFVLACLPLADSTKIVKLQHDPPELRRCLVSFADIQSISSDCIFAQSRTPPFLRRKKRLLRQIYCFMTEESYTVVPAVVCGHLNTPGCFSRESMFLLGYMQLHLIQLNGFGQIYPDSLFENYGRFLRDMAYARKGDMEDCVSFRDEYLTAVKGLPSEYGYTTRPRGYELDYGTAPSAEVDARRGEMQLPPLEIASAMEQ